MDLTLLACLVTLIVISVVVGWRVRLNTRHRRGELAGLPARVTNPRLHAKLRSVRLWQLRVEAPAKACHWAQEAAGRRFSSESAVPVPIAGCGKSCRCQYLPVADGRRIGQNPTPNNEPLEFERLKPGEAKPPERRRKDGVWSGARNRH